MRSRPAVARAAVVASFVLALLPSLVFSPLVSAQGWHVLPSLLAPVGVAGIALLLYPTGRPRLVFGVAALLLTAFVVLGLLSIGIFYLPAALAMLTAAVLAARGSPR